MPVIVTGTVFHQTLLRIIQIESIPTPSGYHGNRFRHSAPVRE